MSEGPWIEPEPVDQIDAAEARLVGVLRWTAGIVAGFGALIFVLGAIGTGIIAGEVLSDEFDNPGLGDAIFWVTIMGPLSTTGLGVLGVGVGALIRIGSERIGSPRGR